MPQERVGKQCQRCRNEVRLISYSIPFGAFWGMLFGAYCCMRPTTIGTSPPAWEKMKRMS